MVRPCVARGLVDLGDAALHQCIRSLIGARSGLPTIMDISARASSLADRPQAGRSGHQCSHTPGRPILHLVSSSRRPRRVVTSSIVVHWRRSFVRALRPFLRPDLPAQARRAQEPVKAGRRAAWRLASALPGHALTGSSTARGSSWLGCCLICLDALECAPLVQNRPGNAGELVGERNGQHVVV
jgi:hypothetical protein